MATALGIHAECRSCKSWNNRSEYKLPQWLDNVPEKMIPYTSLPNLLRITANLRRYLDVHQERDAEQGGECERAARIRRRVRAG